MVFRPYCVINPLTVKRTLWTECRDVVQRSNVSLATERPSPSRQLLKASLEVNVNCECVPCG